MPDCNDENEGTQIFFASRRHRGALRPRTRNGARSARVKIRPQLLQPLSSSVFLERGRTRWPMASPAMACAAAQCLELCWSLCNFTASARCLHAGSVHHLPSFASSRAASTPGIDHEAVLHTCVSRVLCGTVPARWHVFVCQYFIKAVALHASPHSSWTRSTTVRPVAAHIEPTDSASGRTDRRRRYKETSPVRRSTQSSHHNSCGRVATFATSRCCCFSLCHPPLGFGASTTPPLGFGASATPSHQRCFVCAVCVAAHFWACHPLRWAWLPRDSAWSAASTVACNQRPRAVHTESATRQQPLLAWQGYLGQSTLHKAR